MEACTAPASGDRYAPPYSAFPGERQNAKAAIQPSPKARQTFPFEINGLLSLSNPRKGEVPNPELRKTSGCRTYWTLLAPAARISRGSMATVLRSKSTICGPASGLPSTDTSTPLALPTRMVNPDLSGIR